MVGTTKSSPDASFFFQGLSMQMQVAYRQRSSVMTTPTAVAMALAPNLRRDRVSYVGMLKDALHFREAISALHDVVISDLRYKPKDNSAYEAYQQEVRRREAVIRTGATSKALTALHQALPEIPVGFEDHFRKVRTLYWGKRQDYSNYLSRHDPEVWRLLMPCDPVITVAPDTVFFECFSADESSYGCLSVDRDRFIQERDVALGTTNVDYSWNLYEHFQQLRSYRQTQFSIDPSGFESKTTDTDGHREEKIDLPNSWLRGFMQLQAAMGLPTRKVPLSREALYSILAFLKRNKAKRSPRALRFDLDPGKPVKLTLEPWNREIHLPTTLYPGQRAETIRIWGRDRLHLLSRLLPIMDRAEVYLLGTGFPSFWVLHLGGMRLTLGLSGWTTNDWTGASGLDQLAPPANPSADLLGDLAGVFRNAPALTFEQLRSRTGASVPYTAAGLNKLALLGQIIYDIPANLYRWRQIMPPEVSLEKVQFDNPETVAAKDLMARKQVKLETNDKRPDGLQIIAGKVGERPVSLLLDADGRMLRAKCTCSHHFTGGLKRGPCRHLQAARTKALGHTTEQVKSVEQWFNALWN
ncbi:MAG: hypothetical protein QM703_07335 [Gemmatales bacterium]